MMNIKVCHSGFNAVFSLVFLVTVYASLLLSSEAHLRGPPKRIWESDKQALNEEADRDFRTWLDYVRKTSDDVSELEEEERNLEFADEHDRVHTPDEEREEHSSPRKVQDFRSFRPTKIILVAKDGSGDYNTVQDAVDAVPEGNKKRILMKIKAGIYNEKVTISRGKRYITIEGELNKNNRIVTVIRFNNTAGDIGPKGLPLKTIGSATFAVNAKNFIARDVIFQNTAPTPEQGQIGGQGVALRVSADKVAFYNCRFYGKQDTLYDHKGRHYFRNCYVEGTVDFLFGNGRSLYQDCHLHALSNNGMPGTITAQKRNGTSLSTGFSILSSLITGTGVAYLGRAWGNDSRVVFSNTFMDEVVIPEGWDDWGLPDREKSVFYAEFNCSGPGAHSRGRVHWARELSYEDAKPFLSVSFINGKKWLQLPHTHSAKSRKGAFSRATPGIGEPSVVRSGLQLSPEEEN